MLKKIIVRSIALTTATVLGGSAYVISYSPELRSSPSKLSRAMVRGGRLAKLGVKAAAIYTVKSQNFPFFILFLIVRPQLIKQFSSQSKTDKHTQVATMVKETFRQNAGTYIKFGQLIASLEILVPDEYCKIMRSMYENAPTSSYEQVKQTIEQEFNLPIDQIFSEFNKEPISSASIAQVHIAKLRSNGQTVAVKIQHNWLKEELSIDTRMVELCINVGHAFFKDFNYDFLVKDLKKNMPRELNFKLEGQNCEQMGKLFANEPQIRVPKVYWESSSEKVLTMEFIKGLSIDKIPQLKEQGHNFREIATLLADCIAKQIFVYGVVHADPHGGNVFVRKEKGREQLVFLDHGLYQRLDPKTRISYCYLWKGIVERDERLIKKGCDGLKVGNHRLFAGMLTSKNWEDIMNPTIDSLEERLKGPQNDEEKALIMKKSLIWKDQIVELLSEMDQDLLLIFKVNDYVRTLDNRLGTPVNSLYWTMKHCFNVIDTHELDMIKSPLSRGYQGFKMFWKTQFNLLLIYMIQIYAQLFWRQSEYAGLSAEQLKDRRTADKLRKESEQRKKALQMLY